MSNFFRGYDSWKLATPPEYEEDGVECEECLGTGTLYVVYSWHGYPQDGEEDCPECSGTGRGAKAPRDPDEAREAQKDSELE